MSERYSGAVPVTTECMMTQFICDALFNRKPVQFTLSNTGVVTWSKARSKAQDGFRLALRRFTISPALEKILSDGNGDQ